MTSRLASTSASRSANRLADALDGAHEHASVTRLWCRCAREVRDSWTYRWLTAEPSAAVVVIDLRETRTIGPIIAVLDLIGRTLQPMAERLALFGSRFNSAITRRPVTAVSVATTAIVVSLIVMLANAGVSTVALIALATVAILSLLMFRVDLAWADLEQPTSYRWLLEALTPPETPSTQRNSENGE